MNFAKSIMVFVGMVALAAMLCLVGAMAYEGYQYTERQVAAPTQAPKPTPQPPYPPGFMSNPEHAKHGIVPDYTYVFTKQTDASSGLVCFWLQPRYGVDPERNVFPIALGCGPDLSPYDTAQQP